MAVATMVVGILMPGAVTAIAAMLGTELTPGGVVAVAAMMAVVILMPGAVVTVAVAAVMVRNEDEGVPGRMVPGTVPAGMAARMRLLVARNLPLRIVQHAVEGTRGNPEENCLSGRKVMSALAGVALSISGERRLDAEREQREQRRERIRTRGPSGRS